MSLARGALYGRILLGCALGAAWAHPVCAAPGVSPQDQVVGTTFKAMARAYVATADIGALKQQAIQRVGRMQEPRFQRKYAEVYALLKELPAPMRRRLGITEAMTQSRAAEIIRGLDRKTLYDMIDRLPDPAIAREFYGRPSSQEDGAGGEDVFARVSRAWGRLVARISPRGGRTK